MPNLMQTGADWLGDRLKAAAGRTVTLQLEEGEVELTGWVARHEYEVTNAEDFTTLVVSYDWTFKREDLLLNSQSVLPQRGNRIVETLNSQDVTYEVILLPQRGAQEELDTSHVLVTVHTARIGVDG